MWGGGDLSQARLVNKQWLTWLCSKSARKQTNVDKAFTGSTLLVSIAAHLFHKLSPSPFQLLLLLIKTFGTFFPFTFPRSTLQCLKLSCREQELNIFCPLNLVMNSPDDTLLKRHNTSSYLSHLGPPPLSGWVSFRPSAKPNVQSCSSPSPSAQPSPGSRDSTFFNPGPTAMEGQISCRRLEGFKTTLGLSPGHLPTFAGDSCLDKY